MWDLVFKTLNEASKKCVDAANKSYNSFEMVIQDIDELMDFLDDLPYYERKYTKYYYSKMKELKERFKLKQEEYVKKMNRDKKAFEDAKNNIEKALKEYRVIIYTLFLNSFYKKISHITPLTDHEYHESIMGDCP